MQKTTEWKRLSLSKEALDFSKATQASLECDGDTFISLTFKLKTGQTVRIRKCDYTIAVEAPVIPTDTLFAVKVGQLQTTFKTREEAERALGSLDGDISEVSVPRVPQLEDQSLPF